jgi:hypothetical protein
MVISGKKFVEVQSGCLVKCIKKNEYSYIGETKRVDNETTAFYGLMVGNGYFEIDL